ncbi:MAG: VOC family protein [Paenibacillaceae bacterium]|nr:VOC family protein [Paenibacillaceae bacterium]
MKKVEAAAAKLTGVDCVYIPVTNKQEAVAWFVKHFGLVIEGDHLLAGRQEIFLLHADEQHPLYFETDDWLADEKSYKMPVICFQTDDILQLYKYLLKEGIQLEELHERSWFWEFDFYDLDKNKFKVWQPKNEPQ